MRLLTNRHRPIGLLLLLAGCEPEPDASRPRWGGPEVDEADRRLPTCHAYRDVENAWGYCVYTLAGGFPTRKDVEELCSVAGEWENECRHAWVAGRMQVGSGFSTEELLEVCKGNADCAFELIEFRRAEEVTEQMDLCRKHAGRYAEDCVGHALQRWWLEKPDAAEVARIASMKTDFPRKVAYWVAASVHCSNIGTCDGDPVVKEQCEVQVEVFGRRPDSCPQQQWTVMPHNQDRGAPQGPGPNGPGSGGPTTPGNPPGTPGVNPPGAPPRPPPGVHQPGTIPPPR